MDFSNAGATKPAGAGFRAHVQWKDKGNQTEISTAQTAKTSRRPSVAPGTYPFSVFRKARTLPEELGLEPLSTCLLAGTGGARLRHVLSLYFFEDKEGPEWSFLSDTPFNRFCLPGPGVRQQGTALP